MHIIPIGTNKNKERYPKKDIKWLMSSLEYVSMEVFIFFVFNPWENSNCDFFNLAIVFCFLFFFCLRNSDFSLTILCLHFHNFL